MQGKKKEAEPEAEPESAPVEAPTPVHDYDPPKEKVLIKPENQLHLTEEDLDEEITKMCTANNPNAPSNVVRFQSTERTYKIEPIVEQYMMQYKSDGFLLHKSSEDAKKQQELERLEADAKAAFEAELKKPKEDRDGEEFEESKQLRNQFNFIERAIHTYNNPMKERGTVTEPPPRSALNDTVNQAIIFDAYMADQERQRQHREMMKNKGKKGAKAEEEEKAPEKQKDVIHGEDMGKASKVVERMINQNSFDDITQDFKYWDDASDEFREGEGTLLPLWKFYCDKVRRKQVTSLCWNPEFSDLFAVGYGSYEFTRQGSGLICCYSLKNPSNPEFTFTTESGVMCLDFHPQHSSLLAAGLYDGSVVVFDVRDKVNRPMFQSTAKTGKHTEPVWQVSWQEEDMSKSLQFFSTSSDGRVTLWTITKSELEHSDVMELKPVAPESKSGEIDDDTALASLTGGFCFDFNKTSDHLFIVGTEEGQIHKCSKAYTSQYLETYFGHNMSVYSVKWNPYHPNVFLSGSADWQIRLWDHNHNKSLFSFDLNNSVGDVAWAPYSSTVFAAVTSDGKVHVYDLSANKHEPVCEQKVVRKANLTKIVFNPKDPIVLVGDDRGCVTSLKLSPNLRRALNEDADKETQIKNLQKLMDNALKGEGNL